MAAKTLSSKLVLLGIFLLFVLLDLVAGKAHLGDVDDLMRDYQIRDLLSDGQWFDLTMPFIAMPDPYVSPWSRLIDFPYIAITYVLSGFMGQEAALLISYKVWPLLMLVPVAWLVYEILHRSLGERPNLLELLITSVLMIYAIWEFVPGSIDHHNMQLLLMMSLCYGVVRWDGAGAVISGIAAIASIQIGLETLPLICAAFFGIALAWVVDRDKRFMARASIALIVGVGIFTPIQPGWARVSEIACDAYSAPYIVACLLAGLFLLAASLLGNWLHGAVPRLALLSLMAVVLVGVLAYMFPLCLEGPYHMIDPVSRAYWLAPLTQERGILSIVAERPQLVFAAGVFQLLFAPGFILLALHKFREGQIQWVILCLLALAAVLLTLYQMRNILFMVLLVPLCVPWTIRNVIMVKLHARERSADLSPLRAVLMIGVPMLVVGLGTVWYFSNLHEVRATKVELDGLRYLKYDKCEDESRANLAYLNSIAPGRIMAGDGTSVAIAEVVTRNGLDHTIAALPFHRASPGIRQVAIAFTSSRAERDGVLRSFDYVAVCVLPAKLAAATDMSKAPLFEVLNDAKSVEGFELMPPVKGTRLRIYKIVAPIKQ